MNTDVCRPDAALADATGPDCMGCSKPRKECGPGPAEPPDGTRIEFEQWTDVFGAWRDDLGSRQAGYPPEVAWCLYGRSVPVSWAQLCADYGACVLATAVRLVPHPDDAGN